MNIVKKFMIRQLLKDKNEINRSSNILIAFNILMADCKTQMDIENSKKLIKKYARKYKIDISKMGIKL